MFIGKPSQFELAQTSVDALAPEHLSSGDIIQRSLRAARMHLGLEVAYLSEIIDNDSVYRSVDAPGFEDLIKVGDKRSLNDVYCRHILEGRLPQLMPDTSAEPLATSMPITAAVPIGAHVSVPVRLRTGEIFGMFCCLGPKPNCCCNTKTI